MHLSDKLAERKAIVAVGLLVVSLLVLWTLWVFAKTAVSSSSPRSLREGAHEVASRHPACDHSRASSYDGRDGRV